MRFFLDNCVSRAIAESISVLARSQNQTVVHLTDKFDPSTPDVDWIRQLADEGDWIIVSADPRITHSRAEQEAWRESGLTAFFLDDFARRSFWIQAHELVRWWPQIVQISREGAIGSGYLLKFNAKNVVNIYDPIARQDL